VAAHPDDPVIAVAEAMAAPADERTPDALALVADLYAWTQEQGGHGSDCPYGRDIGEHPGDTSIKERKEKGCTCGLWDWEKRADAMLNGNRADPFPAPADERTETLAAKVIGAARKMAEDWAAGSSPTPAFLYLCKALAALSAASPDTRGETTTKEEKGDRT
jgi:hypothetical protein